MKCLMYFKICWSTWQNLLLVTPYVQYSFKLTNILKGYRQTQEKAEHAHLKQLVLSWLHIFPHWTRAVQQVKTGNMYIGSRRWRPVQWHLSITHDFDRLASNDSGVLHRGRKSAMSFLYFTEVPDMIHADYLTDRWLRDLKARMNCSVWSVLSTVVD